MIIILVTFTASLCLTGFSSAAQNVNQTPPDLFKNKEKFAELHCSHSIPSYQVILWYKQYENKFSLLGYLNLGSKFPEEALKTKITLDGNGRNNSTLTITNLQPNDSAVYFCAASQAQCCRLLCTLTKTSSFRAAGMILLLQKTSYLPNKDT
ncbi:hypothetical protein AOLI_G00120020 [Acnodon oligacanthus]